MTNIGPFQPGQNIKGVHRSDSVTSRAKLELDLKTFLVNLVRQFPQITDDHSNPATNALHTMKAKRKARLTGETDPLLIKASQPVRSTGSSPRLQYVLVGSVATSLWAFAQSYQSVTLDLTQSGVSINLNKDQRNKFQEFLRPIKDIDLFPFDLYTMTPNSLSGVIDSPIGVAEKNVIAIDSRSQDLRDEGNKGNFVKLKIDDQDFYTLEPRYLFAYKLLYSVIQNHTNASDKQKNLKDLEVLLEASQGIHDNDKIKESVTEIFTHCKEKGIQQDALEKELGIDFGRTKLLDYLYEFQNGLRTDSTLRLWLLGNIIEI